MRHAIVPIRSFDGMTRLAPVLDDPRRREMSLALAKRTLDAITACGLPVTVVTDDTDVIDLAHRYGTTTPDDPAGLSAAVEPAVAALGSGDWVVIHADLPLIDDAAIRRLTSAADAHGSALAPSLDGGTNLFAGTGPTSFFYGADSFHAHLAAHPTAAVVIDVRLAVELDTPRHLAALSSLGLVPSLSA